MGRNVILYIACSLDGYIAGENDDLSFLKQAETDGEDYGFAEFIVSVDTVILGKNTYDWLLAEVGSYPYADKTTYLLTHSAIEQTDMFTPFSGDICNLVASLKNEASDKDIFLMGGANVAQQVLMQNLIDEIRLFIIPVLLGKGTLLWNAGEARQLILKQTSAYNSGVVCMHYLL